MYSNIIKHFNNGRQASGFPHSQASTQGLQIGLGNEVFANGWQVYSLGLLESEFGSQLCNLYMFIYFPQTGQTGAFVWCSLGLVMYEMETWGTFPRSEGLLRAIATHMPTRFDDMTDTPSRKHMAIR